MRTIAMTMMLVLGGTSAVLAAPNSHPVPSSTAPVPTLQQPPRPQMPAKSQDYQTWLHRHDGLAQYNTPKGLDPSWYHRHDGLRQYNTGK